MPNRIIKESICTSDNLDGLTAEEERFFYRLMVQVDDFGRMDARPAILRAACFPLKTERITNDHIKRWLTTLEQADLIQLYTVEGKPYLQFTTWERHQQRRAKYSKYPSADDADLKSYDSKHKQLLEDVSEESRNEESRNEESRSAADKPPAPTPTPRKQGARAKTEKPPDESMTHPAVQAYRELCRSTPAPVIRLAIMQRVADVDKWRGVIAAWLGAGYRPTNVTGMLEWYSDGIPTRRNGNSNGHSASPGAPRLTPMQQAILEVAQEEGIEL